MRTNKNTARWIGVGALALALAAGAALAAFQVHWSDTLISEDHHVWWGNAWLKCDQELGLFHLVTYKDTDGVRGLTRGDVIMSVVDCREGTCF